MLGRYEEAITAAQAPLTLHADAPDAWLVLAAAESAVQNNTAARAAMNEVLRVKPNLTLDAYLQTQPYANEKHVRELADRLRSAGLR